MLRLSHVSGRFVLITNPVTDKGPCADGMRTGSVPEDL